jgi:hypothetical protein
MSGGRNQTQLEKENQYLHQLLKNTMQNNAQTAPVYNEESNKSASLESPEQRPAEKKVQASVDSRLNPIVN